MAIRNLPGWSNVGGSGGNGAAYFGIGARMLDNAAKGLEGAATKHEQEIEKMETKHITESTAKLAELARKNGGKLTQEDYDKFGAYDPKLLDNMLGKASDRAMAERKFNADQAYRSASLGQNSLARILEKYEGKARIDQQYGRRGYGTSSKGKSGKAKSGSKGSYVNVLNQALEDLGIPDAMDVGSKLEYAEEGARTGMRPEEFYESVTSSLSYNPISGTLIPFRDEAQLGSGFFDKTKQQNIMYNNRFVNK